MAAAQEEWLLRKGAGSCDTAEDLTATARPLSATEFLGWVRNHRARLKGRPSG